MSKTSHFKRVRNGSGQSGFKLGRVDSYFYMDFYLFIFIKKTKCICHLESHAVNYFM